MPVTINPNGTSDPPQFEITISTPDGSAMSSVTLYRQIGGIQTQTRVQPIAGLASRFITDPEAPWDTPVSYVAAMTYGAGGASSRTDASAPATLTPTPASIWAVHPTVPSLSMPVDAGAFSQLGIAQAGDLVYAAQATQHPILGSKVPILTKIGTRRAATWSIDLTSMTLNERTALLALADDETPILFRAPAAWGWGLDEGYYAIGDLTESRRWQYGPEPSRTFRLPLTKVAAPAGAQQSSWSWGGLMAGYADWPAVQAAFADWNAVTADRPS
jgi:hypothetical protein